MPAIHSKPYHYEDHAQPDQRVRADSGKIYVMQDTRNGMEVTSESDGVYVGCYLSWFLVELGIMEHESGR